MFLRVQNKVPFWMIVEMIFQRSAEFGVLEAWLEAFDKTPAPGLPNGQPWLDFGIGHLMVVPGFDRLAKTR